MSGSWNNILRRLPGWRESPGSSQEHTGLEKLTNLLRRFTVEQQQVPKDLAELVAKKYLDAVPAPPSGQRYIIDRSRVEVRLE